MSTQLVLVNAWDVAEAVLLTGLVKINDVPVLSVVLLGEVLYRPRAENLKLPQQVSQECLIARINWKLLA